MIVVDHLQQTLLSSRYKYLSLHASPNPRFDSNQIWSFAPLISWLDVSLCTDLCTLICSYVAGCNFRKTQVLLRIICQGAVFILGRSRRTEFE